MSDLTRPIIYVPGDLDLVVRVNVQRYRETMGPDPELSLERIWENFGPSDVSSDERAVLVKLLRGCDSLWLGCRLSESGCRDYVVVLRGQWSGNHREYGFGPERSHRDLGGGWLSFDYATARRTSIARLYWRPPELSVLVSAAELDSTERAIEQSSDRTEMEPSENGLVSLVARSAGLARALRPRAPKGASWLEQSKRVEILLEPSAAASVATFTVVFNNESAAKRSAEAVRVLVSALVGFDSRFGTKNVLLEQIGAQVVLRVAMPTTGQNH